MSKLITALGFDFCLQTNTQINIRWFFFCAKFVTLATIFCVFVLSKNVLLVNTQIHITKWPDFHVCILKILFVAQINPPCGTFIGVTNIILQMKQMLNHCWFCPQKSQKSDICVSVEGGGALSQTQTFCFRMHSTAAAAASDAALVAVGATVAELPPLPLSPSPPLSPLPPPQLPFPALLLPLSSWLLSAPVAASVSTCHHHCLLTPLPLLSAGTIAAVAIAATAAPVISAITATTAAYFSAAGTAASMFPSPPPMFVPPPLPLPLFLLLMHHHLCFQPHCHPSFHHGSYQWQKVLACNLFGASRGRWQRTPWSSWLGVRGLF